MTATITNRWRLLCLPFLLNGCVTVNIDSNINYDVMPRFGRVLVISRVDRDDRQYLYEFERAFPLEYEVCAISVNKLAFGSPDSLIQERARQCRSEVMLTLELNRTYTSGGGKYIDTNQEVFLEMSTLPDRKPFWKGVARTDGSVFIPPRRIVRKLYEDRLIDGKIPPPTVAQTSR